MATGIDTPFVSSAFYDGSSAAIVRLAFLCIFAIVFLSQAIGVLKTGKSTSGHSAPFNVLLFVVILLFFSQILSVAVLKVVAFNRKDVHSGLITALILLNGVPDAMFLASLFLVLYNREREAMKLSVHMPLATVRKVVGWVFIVTLVAISVAETVFYRHQVMTTSPSTIARVNAAFNFKMMERKLGQSQAAIFLAAALLFAISAFKLRSKVNRAFTLDTVCWSVVLSCESLLTSAYCRSLLNWPLLSLRSSLS